MALELKTNYGAKPAEGINNNLRLINSVPSEGGTVTGATPLAGRAGDSTKPVAIEIGEGVTLVSTSGDEADLVQLSSSAYLIYSDATSNLVRNGGFAAEAGGERRIYGTFANAAKAASGGVVMLLHDYTGTEPLKSGNANAVLDLAGHTYTYTGSQAIAEVNYNNASLTLSNGTLVGTNASADGIQMVYSGSSLLLDGVSVSVSGSCYGIVTNGMETNNTVTLRNSSLSVPEGFGIYFPSTGAVTIDNSTITAKFSGVQMCAGSLAVRGDKTSITVTGQPQEKTEGDGVIADGAAISVVEREGYQDLRSVSITSGTFSSASGVGAIKAYSFNNADKTEGKWASAGDVVTVSGGSFSSEVPADLCADGLAPVKDAEGNYTVAPSESAVATVSAADGSLVGAYESLQEAVNAVPAGGTVALTDNVTGNGVKVDDNREFTLDLGGFTYTVDGGLVGSVGTETNGFQLLQGNDITIKNGRISSDKALILIQNYSDLVLEDVDLVGGATTQYILSNNCGEVHIGRGTTITASRGRAAFDVCRFGNYDSVRVTVDEGAGAIVGRIEVADANGTGTGAWSLTINGGDLSQAELSVQNADEATIEKSPSVALPAPDGYQWVDGELAKESDPAVKTVASITDGAGNVTYFSTLAEAVKAAGDGQTVALLGNVTESVSVPDGVSVTLDLAGHTLTNADGQHTVTVEKGGSLTIVDSSADKTGVIDNVTHGRGALVNYGTVTVESGELTRSAEASKSPTDNGGNSWYVVDNQGTMTFNGGKVVNESHYSSLVRNLNGTLTINGGTFENPFIALKNDDGGTLTVAGGTVTSEEQAIQSWSTTTVSGGTLNGRVTSWDYEDSGNESLLTVSGGTINGDVQAINYMGAEKGPEVVITGGTVTGKVQKATHDGSTGTKPADPTADSSTIIVSGGTFASPIDDALIVPGSGLNKNDDGTYGVHEHKAEAVAAVAPTCDKDGNKAHWRCGVCGELFADEAMTQSVAAEDVVLPATHHANATHVAAVEPTETTAGNYEYWHCPDCGRYFTDAALTQETTLAALTRPALGQEPVETHTVTFDFGTGEPSKTVTVADGEAVPRPDDPVFEGWTFAGWFTDKGTFQDAYDFSTPVTDDITLYAGWYEKEAEEGVKPTTPTTETGDKTGDVLASTGDTTFAAAPLAAAVLGASAVAAGVVARRRKE